eukprot:3859323-Pleurochrysis_carterae.AAC.5
MNETKDKVTVSRAAPRAARWRGAGSMDAASMVAYATEVAVAREIRQTEHELAECEARNTALVTLITAVQAQSDELHRKWLAERSECAQHEHHVATRVEMMAASQSLLGGHQGGSERGLAEKMGWCASKNLVRLRPQGSSCSPVASLQAEDSTPGIDVHTVLDDVLNLRFKRLISRREENSSAESLALYSTSAKLYRIIILDRAMLGEKAPDTVLGCARLIKMFQANRHETRAA